MYLLHFYLDISPKIYYFYIRHLMMLFSKEEAKEETL